MPIFKCPDCGNIFEFTPEEASGGCTPMERCPFCRTYVELTSEKIVAAPDRRSSKITPS